MSKSKAHAQILSVSFFLGAFLSLSPRFMDGTPDPTHIYRFPPPPCLLDLLVLFAVQNPSFSFPDPPSSPLPLPPECSFNLATSIPGSFF